jgi:hypothetical protein
MQTTIAFVRKDSHGAGDRHYPDVAEAIVRWRRAEQRKQSPRDARFPRNSGARFGGSR